MVGDRAVTDLQLFMHLLIRTIVFISIPIGLYLGMFYIHLNTLYKAGPNDNIMTSAFQASLEVRFVAVFKLHMRHGKLVLFNHTEG